MSVSLEGNAIGLRLISGFEIKNDAPSSLFKLHMTHELIKAVILPQF